LPEEIEACKEYLDRQLKVIKPRTIVALGRFSMAKFLPYGKISRDHGIAGLVDYNGERYIFVPMFHPAAALRSGEVEKQLREDFLKMPKEIERLKKPISLEEEKNDDQDEQLELI
jgi:DNA polymerase